MRVFSSRSSHSHTIRIFHPNFLRANTFLLSLAVFSENFRSQNRPLVLGVVASGHPLCRCQKHPCTKIILLRDGNTISGVPGKSLLCRRNLYPRACRTLRTFSSGVVSELRTRDMISLRFALSKISIQRHSVLSHMKSYSEASSSLPIRRR